MRIQHNIPAMSAYRNYTNNVSSVAKNLEKLSSGYKINRAGDDAAGLAISEKMRAQISGLEQAQSNAKSGINLVQTAEGALTEVHDMLNRMVTLAEQSANGTYDDSVDRVQLQKEVDQLRTEIDRIADSANFNGIKLLDGSLEAGKSTTKYSDALKIAEWVGSTANATADVGDGTIVHTGAKEAKKASFSVEFNNATVNSGNGASITIGSGDKAVELTLDGKDVAVGASSEEIAAAFAKKYGKDGVNFKSDAGEDVKFTVTADKDRLVFEQEEDPISASQLVGGKMAVTYEGIGVRNTKGPIYNTAELTATIDPKKNAAHAGAAQADANRAAAGAFVWDTDATDESKDKLNEILAGGATVSITATADGTDEENVASVDVNLKGLIEALGDGYEVSAQFGQDGSEADQTIGDNGKITGLTAGATRDNLILTIKEKGGGKVGTLTLTTPKETGGLAEDEGTKGTAANGDTDAVLTTKVTIGAGSMETMNTKPLVSVTDGGKMTNPANPAAAAFTFDTTDYAQLDALNKVLEGEAGTITLSLGDLTGNSVTANTSKLYGTLSDALKAAGYYLKGGTSITANKMDEDGLVITAAGAASEIELYDKDDNKIGHFTMKLDATNLESADTVITLSQSRFSQGTKVTDGVKETGVSIKLEAASPEDGSDPTTEIKDWTSTTAATLHAGDKFTISIDNKDYTVTLVDGGANAEDVANGLVIDMSNTTALANTQPATLLNALKDAVQKQMDAEAKEAAGGSANYVKYESLTFTAETADKSKLTVKANTTEYTYVPTDAQVNGAGGKDPNASTVNITSGQVKDDGRLASTYFGKEMLAGLKDGSQLKVGDTVYTFAVGKDSKVAGDNVVDLKDMTAEDSDLIDVALERLTKTGNPNAMFSIGFDEGRLTFTENKEYEWGEGVDLSTAAGIAEQFGFSAEGASVGKALTLQIGDTAEDFNKLSVNVKDMHADAMGIGNIDISSQAGAADAMDKIKAAVNYVSDVRGTLGATQNRLDHTINNLSVMQENIQDAESTIRDVDVAKEMMEYTKNNILVQSAQAMLAQANQLPQGVLQLLG